MAGAMIRVRCHAGRPRRRYHKGAALIMLMALLTMGVLYFLVVQLEAVSIYERESRQGGGGDSLAQAREALLGYAATYRDDSTHSTEVFGYLPCPDMTGNGDAAGSCGHAGEASVGLLPYKTLGLPDLRDSSGNCLWYAVSGSFKNNPKGIDATLPWTSAPLNWDTQGQFKVVDSGGTTTLVAPDDAHGGAAAVIFAVGPPLGSQSRTAGTQAPCYTNPAQIAAYLDGGNNTIAAIAAASSATITLTQGLVKDATTDNDRLAWVTPKEIFDRVVNRKDFSNALTASPVGHVNKLTNEIKAALEKKIQDDLEANTTSNSQPSDIGSFTQFGKQIGTLPLSLTLNDGNYTNYYANWSGQYRQALCSTLTTPCLTVAGTACRGALMFGGRNASGQPRTSTEQTYSTANLDSYFEAGSGREILNSAATSFAGSIGYTENGTAASRALDVGTCLFPGEFKSFAQDIAGFDGGKTSRGTTSVASVDTTAKTVTLGDTIGGVGTGCVWYPTPLALGTTMRIYFRYQVVTRGRGFTMAIADATTNSPASTTPIMCGATVTTGATRSTSLGYAGAPPTGQASFGGPGINISEISWSASSGGTATVTTESAHGFISGNNVTISGVLPGGYNVPTSSITVISPTQFSYPLASNPGQAPVGIKPPKLAIEFDTSRDTSRVDPSPNHFDFVYWGNASDSDAASTGSDDNTHYAGILGSGAEPLNPRATTGIIPTATPIANVIAATWDGTRVTATTSGAHNFTPGHNVYLSDVTATSYQGTFPIDTVPDSTRFTYAQASDPGAYNYGTSVSRTATISSVAAGVLTTALSHDFAVGDYINLSGFTSSVGCNGTYQVASVPNATSFTLTSYASTCTGGYATATSAIAAASWTGGIVTVTTSSVHNLVLGQYISIANIYPAGYNGTFVITSASPTQFSYSLTTDPGGPYSASAVPGMVTMSTLYPVYLSSPNGTSVPLTTSMVPYNSDSPQSGVIHVRLDVTRSYSASAHQATLTMKAYVADSFGNYDTSNTTYNTCTLGRIPLALRMSGQRRGAEPSPRECLVHTDLGEAEDRQAGIFRIDPGADGRLK
jgi:hypothetical protein